MKILKVICNFFIVYHRVIIVHYLEINFILLSQERKEWRRYKKRNQKRRNGQ